MTLLRIGTNVTQVLSRPLSARSRLGFAVALAVVAVAAGLTELRDPDTFHLLAQGRDLIRRGGFPTEDPFLYPLEGRPVGAGPSWLSALAIYVAHAAAGDAGPVWLSGLLLGALVYVLALDAVGEDSNRPSPDSSSCRCRVRWERPSSRW